LIFVIINKNYLGGHSKMALVDDMLTCKLGETESSLKVTFKKTVKVREYETEVTEVTNEIKIDDSITGMERIFVAEILKSQAEYVMYIDLYERGTVTKDEYMVKRKTIEDTLRTMIDRANGLNIDVSKYIKPNGGSL